jgi:hypothetical protein
MQIESKISDAKKETCKEALEASGLTASLLFQKANSSWRRRPAQTITRQKPVSYNDLSSPAEIDPALLASFGTLDSSAGLAGTTSSTSANLNASNDTSDLHPQCMSGFLHEQARKMICCYPTQQWTERWFVATATDHCSGIELLGFRQDSYASPSRRILVDAVARREAARDTPHKCVFSVGEHGAAQRALLAASSDAQARSWVACLNAMLQSRLPPPTARLPSPSPCGDLDAAHDPCNPDAAPLVLVTRRQRHLGL